MKIEKMEKLIERITKNMKTEEQKKRFIKLISAGLITKEKRKKEIIIKGLYNLENEL